MIEKGGGWVDANDPTTEWDLLHEKYRNGDRDKKFEAMFGAVGMAILILRKQRLNPAILHELHMQLFDKDMGSKSTFLDKKMPKNSSRRKALRPSQDMKKTFAVGAVEAFRKSGLTHEKAVSNVAAISGYKYEKVDDWHDYYFRGMPDGYSYLHYRLAELKKVSKQDALVIGNEWSRLSIGLS